MTNIFSGGLKPPPRLLSFGDGLVFRGKMLVLWRGTWILAPGGQCMEFSRCPAGTKFSSHLGLVTYLLGSKLTLFSYGRDGHQPYSRGLGTHSKDFPMKAGMTIPHIVIFDPGTYDTGD